MEAITITLNGREVSGHPGMSILELARESGVEIPTLCYDPCLASVGACRICLVEDERSGRLAASCVTPIEAGMLINTESARVQERRKTIVSLILASHPDSCIVCDKGNRCELRRIAADLGIGLVNLYKVPQVATIEEVNPFVERDLSKCILCGKCIRADHELVVQGAIDYIHRGFAAKPATLHDLPLEKSECTFCGTCVAVCPTGALMEKERSYTGTAPAAVTTTCALCGCGCSMNLEVKDNLIVRARPGPESPVNRRTLCVRGSYGYDFVHSKERLQKPLVKTDGRFQEVSWDEALDLVASRLGRVKQDHGPGSIGFLSSPRCTNEENYLLQRLARCAIGTNNIDNGSRMYSAAGIVGLGSAVGFPGSTNHIDALERSDAIMVIGANVSSSAPAVAYAVKRAIRNNGAKLILVDPQQTDLSRFAVLWLRPSVGTDLALLHGLAHIIVSESLIDEEFVARKTNDFDSFSRELVKYTPEIVESVTGVPAGDLRDAARLFAEAESASIVFGTGVTQQVNGADTVTALANLAMLTGNIGLRGGIFAMQGDCNSQGAWDMGAAPGLLPGYQCVTDEQSRAKFEERWGCNVPSEPGLTAHEMIEEAAKGNLKFMYVLGEDPLLTFPSRELVRTALESLEFLVMHEMFMTETAKLAHVILPSASFAEKEGSFTNFEGRVQRVRKAVAPAGSSLPDLEIILRLAQAMGSPLPYSGLEQVAQEIEALVPLYRFPAGTGQEPGHQGRLELDPSRSRRLYKGQFPIGFGRFSAIPCEPQTAISGNGFPMVLLRGSVIYHSGSGPESARSRRLLAFSPDAYVEIGNADAGRLGINTGDAVKITSRAGQVTVKAQVSDRMPEGTVFMPAGFDSTPGNSLFGTVLDPRTKAPSMKACAVALERTEL